MHFCIIGCGNIAKTHALILKKLEHFVPGKPVRFSFASRSKAKAEAFKKEFKGDLALGSYEEAFSHKDIDAVVICTPNSDHYGTALEAIAHRKHVIIEKPIANTVEQADEIIARAAKANVQVLIAENHRYRPHVRWLERLIQAGELGVIKMIRMQVMRRHTFKRGEWRTDLASMGGGPFIDGGIHWVNALLTLGGGGAEHITALEAPRTLPHCPQEDTLAISCRLSNGAVGNLTYSWDISGSFPLKFISVHGSRGSVYVANTGMFGIKLKGAFPRLLLFPLRDWKGYVGMWQDFLISLAHESEAHCLCTGAIGRRDLAFVEAAYQSAQNVPPLQIRRDAA